MLDGTFIPTINTTEDSSKCGQGDSYRNFRLAGYFDISDRFALQPLPPLDLHQSKMYLHCKL